MKPLLKIENWEVYGLDAALVGAGFPMQTEPMWHDCTEKDILRGYNLGNTPIGSGHDKFLRQIMVGMTITAPRYWWQEFATYSHTTMNLN